MISAESKKPDEPEQPQDIDASERPKTPNDSSRPKTSHDSLPREQSKDSTPREEKSPPSKNRIKFCAPNPPLALVYRAGNPNLAIEEINEENKKTNSFEIPLPRWCNRVHVYIDMEKRIGYTATLRLDRVGLKKNWQRHLGLNYKVLFVKGGKPVWPY